MAGHVLGMTETFTGLRADGRHDASPAAARPATARSIDGLTAVQVERERRPRHRRADRPARGGRPAAGPLAGAAPADAAHPDRGGAATASTETWRMGYLVDIILTRDTWMHRVDIARATGRPMELTAEHDGRIVADVVRRVGAPPRPAVHACTSPVRPAAPSPRATAARRSPSTPSSSAASCPAGRRGRACSPPRCRSEPGRIGARSGHIGALPCVSSSTVPDDPRGAPDGHAHPDLPDLDRDHRVRAALRRRDLPARRRSGPSPA